MFTKIIMVSIRIFSFFQMFLKHFLYFSIVIYYNITKLFKLLTYGSSAVDPTTRWSGKSSSVSGSGFKTLFSGLGLVRFSSKKLLSVLGFVWSSSRFQSKILTFEFAVETFSLKQSVVLQYEVFNKLHLREISGLS